MGFAPLPRGGFAFVQDARKYTGGKHLVAIGLMSAGQDLCRMTYRRRDAVERLLGWLKEHRRSAPRFEKLASGFLAMAK